MTCIYQTAKEFCSWNVADAHPALVAAISGLLLAGLGSAEVAEAADTESFAPSGHEVAITIPDLGVATFKLGYRHGARAVYAHCGEFSEPVVFIAS